MTIFTLYMNNSLLCMYTRTVAFVAYFLKTLLVCGFCLCVWWSTMFDNIGYMVHCSIVYE